MIGRRPDGALLVQWVAPGRSAARGTDCGRAAVLLLAPDDFDALRGEGTDGAGTAPMM